MVAETLSEWWNGLGGTDTSVFVDTAVMIAIAYVVASVLAMIVVGLMAWWVWKKY